MCWFVNNIIVIADAWYGTHYIGNEFHWRGSLFCFTASVLAIASNLISVCSLNIMGISRFSVIQNPFDSQYLETRFLKSQIAIVIISSFAVVAVHQG